MDAELEIIYQDDSLVAINKPAGLLVHRTALDPHEIKFAVQILRNQIGKWVFPIHRLDKATSGVLLFGLRKQIAHEMSKMVLEHAYTKEYLAIVRGWPPDAFDVDRGIPQGRNKERKEACTKFKRLACTEMPHPVGPFETARYSLLSVNPITGRRHQIRRHLNHVSYPIAGDRWYGDRDHNRFFTEVLDLPQMFLHSRKLSFQHPFSREVVELKASLPEHWIKVLAHLKFEDLEI